MSNSACGSSIETNTPAESLVEAGEMYGRLVFGRYRARHVKCLLNANSGSLIGQRDMALAVIREHRGPTKVALPCSDNNTEQFKIGNTLRVIKSLVHTPSFVLLVSCTAAWPLRQLLAQAVNERVALSRPMTHHRHLRNESQRHRKRKLLLPKILLCPN